MGVEALDFVGIQCAFPGANGYLKPVWLKLEPANLLTSLMREVKGAKTRLSFAV